MKYLIFICIISFAIFFFKDQLANKVADKVEGDFQKIPLAVQEYNKEILGKAYFIKNQKIATEVDSVCKANDRWKFERTTKDIFGKNCLDAAISLH